MIKNQLEDLVKIGKSSAAIDKLLAYVGDKDADIRNLLILRASSLNNSQRDFDGGVIDFEDLKREQNQVAKAILAAIDTAAAEGYLDTELAVEPNRGDCKPMKILFISANPVGTGPFQFEKEFLDIRKIFSDKRACFEVIELFKTTLESLFDKVRIEKPDILHISCASTDKYLFLQKENDTCRSVPYNMLSAAFQMFQPYVKCIFVNTWCSTTFLKKVSIPLKCAIGSKTLVDDMHCIYFSTGFYTAISKGESFQKAFEFGASILAERKAVEKNTKPMSFLMFSNGICSDSTDDTPNDFEIIEPKEISDMLDKRVK